MRLLIGLAAICSLTHLAWAEAPAPFTGPIPVRDFTRYDEFGEIKMSPDGTHYAVPTGKNGRSMLGFIDMKAMKVTGGVRCPEGFQIDEFWWVSNSRVVYTLAERQLGAVAPTPTGEIFAVDIDGGHAKFVYGYRAGEQQTGTHLRVRQASYASPEFLSALPGDERHVLIAEYPWKQGTNKWYFDRDVRPSVSLLDLQSGEKRVIDFAPLHGAQLLLDNAHNVRFAVGLDDHLNQAVTWKPDPKREWTGFELPGFVKDTIEPRLFGSDDQSVWLTATKEGERYDALYRLDLKSKAVTKVFAFDNSDVRDVVRDLADKEVIGAVGYLDKPVYHWLNPQDRAARVYSALLKAFPGQNVRIESKADDGHLAVVFVSSDVNPGDYYLFDTRTMKADYMVAADSWILPDKMRTQEPFVMKARDGTELHGYVTKAAGAGPHPLVVLPHGGPHQVHDAWGYDWEVQLLASRGYSVLQVNYRGSSGFGREFRDAGYRQWGGTMQDDITDATKWAIDQHITSADRICIFGASYGAYAALMGVIREPALYRCAVGEAGVYDLELMYSTADVPHSRTGRNYLEEALGTDKDDLHGRSPVYNADKIQVPVFLIHGKADWRADYEQATRMKAALEKNHKKYEWLALRGEGHGVFDEDTRRDVYEHILDFLDRNLGATAVAGN